MKDIYNFEEIAPVLARGALEDRFDLPREPEETHALCRQLHFIWIGAELPQKYRSNVASYVQNHPDFNVNIWVDRPCSVPGAAVRDIENELSLANRELYRSEQNLGARADIARYEIVRAEGGIYCDIDSLSMRPFDALFSIAFVAATLHPWYNITNAAFGFPKGSRFLDFVIRSLPGNYERQRMRSVPERTGPTFFTTCFLSYADPGVRILDQSLCFSGAPHAGTYAHHTADANWCR